ncbi:MAG: ABC transporter permease [Bacteroidetes bacterium]|nr:MAG: ABC transporter permease [Bacteroidota bacterium]
MFKFILRRLIYGFFVILGVIIVVFLLFHALPGDPVSMMTGQRSDVMSRKVISEELGLEEPLPMQLLLYLNDISVLSVHDDTAENFQKYDYTRLFHVNQNIVVIKRPYLRRSFETKKRVDEIIMENANGTFWLAGAAMLFATFFGVLFGLISALYKGSFFDNALVIISVIGISAPSFVAAILISMLFGYYLHDFTGLPMQGALWDNDPFEGRQLHLKNLILPAFTLGIRPLSTIMQMTRNAMLDVLSQDYIRTAKAKGLGKIQINLKHALRNALNPVITSVSAWLASMMAGTFFIEYIFTWKGLGSVTILAVENKNLPVIMGVTLFVALTFVLVNIIVDILYSIIDPRVRL